MTGPIVQTAVVEGVPPVKIQVGSSFALAYETFDLHLMLPLRMPQDRWMTGTCGHKAPDTDSDSGTADEEAVEARTWSVPNCHPNPSKLILVK